MEGEQAVLLLSIVFRAAAMCGHSENVVLFWDSTMWLHSGAKGWSCLLSFHNASSRVLQKVSDMWQGGYGTWWCGKQAESVWISQRVESGAQGALEWGRPCDTQGRLAWACTRPLRISPILEAPHALLNDLHGGLDYIMESRDGDH